MMIVFCPGGYSSRCTADHILRNWYVVTVTNVIKILVKQTNSSRYNNIHAQYTYNIDSVANQTS